MYRRRTGLARNLRLWYMLRLLNVLQLLAVRRRLDLMRQRAGSSGRMTRCARSSRPITLCMRLEVSGLGIQLRVLLLRRGDDSVHLLRLLLLLDLGVLYVRCRLGVDVVRLRSGRLVRSLQGRGVGVLELEMRVCVELRELGM